MFEAKQEVDVQGLGKIFQVSELWDLGLVALQNVGIKYPLTARDFAFARIQEGEDSSLSLNGSYVREGVLSNTETDKILCVRQSPLLRKKDSKEASEAHRMGQEYYLKMGKYLAQAEEDKNKEPAKRRVLILDDKDPIPTDRFAEDERSLWFFKDQAEKYGYFLRNSKYEINELRFCLWTPKYQKPFVNQLELGGLRNSSSFVLSHRDLGGYNLVRGVSRSGREDAESKSEIFTGSRSVNPRRRAEKI